MNVRPLISLASLMPGTPTLPREAARATGTDLPTRHNPPGEPNMPRRRGLQQDTLELITTHPGINMGQLHDRLGGTAQQLQTTVWALKKKGEVCSTGERGDRRYWPGRKPPKNPAAAPAPIATPEPSRTLTPLPFSKPSAPRLHETATESSLEIVRTAQGLVLVIDGDTITYRIPAAIAEAIRHHPDL